MAGPNLLLGTNLDYVGNQGLNFVLHQLSGDPGTPVLGQLWFNTSLGVPRWYDGSAAQTVWPGTSANTPSTAVVRDSSGNFSAGTITATVTGVASQATLATNATNLDTTGTGGPYQNGSYYLNFGNTTGTRTHTAISDFITAVESVSLDLMTAPAANVSWNTKNITNLLDPVNPQDAATKNYVDTHGGSGTVTSVALTVPGIFTVSGSPITTSGTLAVSLATQTANTVWAGPSSGSAAAPTFRALVALDIPSLAGSAIGSGVVGVTYGGTGANLSATGGANQFVRQSSSGANLTVSAIASADITTALTTPGAIGGTTAAAGTFTALTATGLLLTVASASGAAGFNLPQGTAPTSPNNGDVWTTSSGLFVRIAGSTVGPLGTGGGGGGTVTSVALTVPAIMSVSGSPVTTSGTLAVSLATQTAATVWAGPATGSAAAPTFRALVSTDIPALAYVTSVALALPGIFTVSGSPVTTSGTLTGTLATQTANTVWAGPSSGSAAAPTFRAVASADIATALTTPGPIGGTTANTGAFTVLTAATNVITSGTQTPFTVTTSADTAQTASTEVNGVNLNVSATRQWATGAITTQREVLVQAPTYAFVAASTVTSAATFAITGAPTAGTHATLTNAYALWVQAGQTEIDGVLNVTASASFAALSASGQITSTVSTGTAPLVVASTTAVSNLNASLLLGSTWASPAAIGTGTAAAGTFTTVTASTLTSTVAIGTAPFTVTSTTAVTNLNASLLLGATWASPAAIGGTAAAAGTFTTLTATGLLQTVASATGGAGLNLPQGSAPTSPNNGDVWTTSSGLFVRIAGSTVGPLGTGGGGGTIGGSIASGQVAYGSGTNTIQGSSTLTYGATTGLALAPTAVSSGTQTALVVTTAANTAQTLSTEVNGITFNCSATRQWATGTITTQREVLFQAPTYATVGASTITTAATVAITGAPIVGANVAITNPYALWVQGGTSLFAGQLNTTAVVSIAPLTASSTNQSLLITQPANTGGSPNALRVVGGAHTSLAGGTAAPDVYFSLARTVQFATGGITTVQAVFINAPTYAFVGSSSITNAATVWIDGAPATGTNATITNAYSLYINAGNIFLGAGNISQTGNFLNNITIATTGSAVLVLNAATSNAPVLRFEINSTIEHDIRASSGGGLAFYDMVNSGNIVLSYSAGTISTAFWTAAPTLDATAVGTAAFIVSGGLSVAKQLRLGGVLTSTSSTAATSNSTGAIITSGGLATQAGSWFGGIVTIAPPVVSTGAVTELLITASANTGQTLSTEINGVNFNLSATRQWATGAITTQREFLVQAPTYAFVGASTITNAATLAISGAPIAGTHATLTNTYALWVQGGTSNFAGLVQTVATATGGAGLNLPQGTAPTSPNNGDVWTTSAGLYVQIAGTTVGPLAAATAVAITGSIASTQVAFGSGTSAIQGSSTLTYSATAGLSLSPTAVSSGAPPVSLTIQSPASTGLAMTGSGSTVYPFALSVGMGSPTITTTHVTAPVMTMYVKAPGTIQPTTTTLIDTAATLYVDGVPGAAAGTTITNAWCLFVNGSSTFVGRQFIGGGSSAPSGFAGNVIWGRNNGNSDTVGAEGESVDSTGTSLYTAYTTTGTVQQLDSLTLTAGKWLVEATGTMTVESGTVSIGLTLWAISTTYASTSGAVEGTGNLTYTCATVVGSQQSTTLREVVNIGGNTTYYLNGQSGWTGTAPTYVCQMHAVRLA
jgi:hypothetical protein